MSAADRRLRIAFVVHDYNRHLGHSRYVAELASRFKRDHDVHVFANTFEEPDPAGLTYHHVPAWRPNALASILSFVLPATALVRGRFDIVHAQGLCGLRQNVITAHICQPAWFDGRRPVRRPAGVAEAGVPGVGHPARPAGHAAGGGGPVHRPVRAGAGTTSAATTGWPTRVRVVHHGTDMETFHPRNRGRWRAPSGPSWGWLRVGLRRPVRRRPAEGDAGGDPGGGAGGRASSWWPSPGPTPGRIAAWRRPRGSPTGSGSCPPPTHVERYYAAADVFLFPTFYDAFGLVAAEAMASGLPVDHQPGGRGGRVDPPRGERLADRRPVGRRTRSPTGCERWPADPGLRERMGAAARSAIEAYTWDRAAEQTMAVYREVAETDAGAGR